MIPCLCPHTGVCSLLFLDQDPPIVIDNGEEGQDGAGNDSGKRRKRKPSRHGGKEKEAERIGWRMERIFIVFQERAAADRTTQKAFCLCCQPDKWETLVFLY